MIAMTPSGGGYDEDTFDSGDRKPKQKRPFLPEELAKNLKLLGFATWSDLEPGNTAVYK